MRMTLVLASLLAMFVPCFAQEKRLVVHEWGVFRVSEDIELANADLRGEWDDLPDFVYGQIKGRLVPQHWGAPESVRRPIVFFHATEPMTARVRVDFPGGKPGVWWPGTRVPAALGQNRPPATTFLEWELGIRQPPPGKQPRDSEAKPAPKGHWLDRIRQVKCDEVFAVYGDNRLDVDREKFLYYDGLFPQGKWLRVDAVDNEVGLVNRTKVPLFDVTVVDRRQPDKVRVARLEKIEAGATAADVRFEDQDAFAFPRLASVVMAKQLTSAGLFADEAQSLVDLYTKELFETGGLHVFYRLPQEEYERRLPLKMTPTPTSLVRVGLVVQGNCEPDLAKRVADLVKQMDEANFAKREAAYRQLQQLGKAGFVELARLYRTELSTEVRARLAILLEKLDARSAFPK